MGYSHQSVDGTLWRSAQARLGRSALIVITPPAYTVPVTVSFPSPVASYPACRFPALGAPVSARSCKLMGAFLISPLPPLLLEPSQIAGLLRSTGVAPFPRYYRPSRFPLADHRLPGVAGYTVSLLRRFLDGTRRVFPVAQHDLVTVLSLPTPPKCFAASVLLRRPMLPSPEK